MHDQKSTFSGRNGSDALPPVLFWSEIQGQDQPRLTAMALQANWTVPPSSEMAGVSSRIQFLAKTQLGSSMEIPMVSAAAQIAHSVHVLKAEMATSFERSWHQALRK